MKNLKIFVFVISFVILVSLACGGAPTITPTEVPTQTAYPTYTQPAPTDIPIETQAPAPTNIPDNSNPYENIPPLDGIESISCPDIDISDGVATAECYLISGKGLGIIYFDSYDNLWGIGAAFYEKDDIAYETGKFLAWAGITNGMNGDDIVGAIQDVQNSDVWYTHNTIKIKVAFEDGKVAFLLKPVGN